MKKSVMFLMAAMVMAVSCSIKGNFSGNDLRIIHGAPSELLKIYTVESEEELMVLRKISENLSHRTLKGDDYALLAERMKATVADPSVGGVGIAAPQIGINKRVVVVQRFDKQGEPFEAYPNIYIVKCSEEKQKGPEGCLSVPNERHNVDRFTSVVISYFDVEKGRVVTETIEGFTAVIFQHEVDHLDGVIYTDRVLM
jgi:peptide deformylase